MPRLTSVFFSFTRRSSAGLAVPSWLCSPGPVLIKKHVRGNKYEDGVEEVELIQATPNYVHVKFPSGREATVSVRDVAPIGEYRPSEGQERYEQGSTPATTVNCDSVEVNNDLDNEMNKHANENDTENNGHNPGGSEHRNDVPNKDLINSGLFSSSDEDEEFIGFRRSTRIRDKPHVNYKV